MKRYVRLRPRVAAMGGQTSAFRSLEARVAIVGVIVATLSAVISGVSSYLSWRQIRILSDEHMTPYRSIFYATKVESYKDVVGTIYRYRMAAVHLNNLLNYYPGTRASQEPNSGYALRPDDQLIKYASVVNDVHEEFQIMLARNQSIWSPAISKQLDALTDADRELCLCARFLMDYKTYARRFSSQFGQFSHECEEPRFSENFINKFEKLEADMQKELRTEQLRTIS